MMHDLKDDDHERRTVTKWVWRGVGIVGLGFLVLAIFVTVRDSINEERKAEENRIILVTATAEAYSAALARRTAVAVRNMSAEATHTAKEATRVARPTSTPIPTSTPTPPNLGITLHQAQSDLERMGFSFFRMDDRLVTGDYEYPSNNTSSGQGVFGSGSASINLMGESKDLDKTELQVYDIWTEERVRQAVAMRNAFVGTILPHWDGELDGNETIVVREGYPDSYIIMEKLSANSISVKIMTLKEKEFSDFISDILFGDGNTKQGD